MNVSTCTSPLSETHADAVVIGHFAAETPTAPGADRATGGLLAKLIEGQEITGQRSDLTSLLAPAGVAAGQLLVVGLGERGKLNPGTAFRAAAAAAKQLAGKTRAKVAFWFDDPALAQVAEHAVAGAIVGCQGQDLYRRE